jgi:hypothetical protein
MWTLDFPEKAHERWKIKREFQYFWNTVKQIFNIFYAIARDLLYVCHTFAYVNKRPTRCNYTQFILSLNCCTYFGWFLHPSSEGQITLSTASGTSQPWLLPVAVVGGLRLVWVCCVQQRLTSTRCCKYSYLCSWWRVEKPLETCNSISWRMKDQLDVTCHFISLIMCSTCFGH